MKTNSDKKETRKTASAKVLSARDRIKPRGLFGLFKGRIHYDENEDIFNLKPL